MDIFNSDADGIRKLMDECHSNIATIAALHPEVMEQFERQYEMDNKVYGKLPTYICIMTSSGIVNTTIRYSEFLRILPMFKQRPDLMDTPLARSISNRKEIPLNNKSDSASLIFGMPPIPRR